MSFLASMSKFQVLETLIRVGHTNILGTLGGSYSFCISERGWLENVCEMGSSRPMLRYHVDFSIS
jgi:hypothetical protein